MNTSTELKSGEGQSVDKTTAQERKAKVTSKKIKRDNAIQGTRDSRNWAHFRNER
jgi:hypothetical protein